MTKTRIIDVPISYVYKLVPPKKRNALEYNIIENVPVEIPDLTPAEAPVAMRFKPLSSQWSGDKPMDHHWFDERLYAPFGRAASGQSSLTLDVDGLLKLMADRNSDGYYVPFEVPRKLWDKQLPYMDIKDLPPGREEDNGAIERAEKVAKVQRRAAEMIFVDGRVYLTCEEPVYHFGYSSRWGSHKVKEDESLCYLQTTRPSEVKVHEGPDWYYRVDRLNEALARIRDIDERNGHKTPDDLSQIAWNQVQVLLPEAVRWHFDPRPRVDYTLDSTFDEMKRHLPEAKLPFMQTFVAFRTLRGEEPRDYDKVASFFENELIPAMEAEKLDPDRVRRTVSEWVTREDPSAMPTNDLAAMVKA
ncbi:hypothetical protein ACVIGB_000085 [Bradyrhizobium sp. USDA 4341]